MSFLSVVVARMLWLDGITRRNNAKNRKLAMGVCNCDEILRTLKITVYPQTWKHASCDEYIFQCVKLLNGTRCRKFHPGITA